jgi:hypothetical protein
MRSSSNFEQECERELEQEKEVETEIQIQVSHQTPASESDWNYSSVGRWSTQDYCISNTRSLHLLPMSFGPKSSFKMLSGSRGLSTSSVPIILFDLCPLLESS